MPESSGMEKYGRAIFYYPASGVNSTVGKIVNVYRYVSSGKFIVLGGGECSCSNGTYGTGSAYIYVGYVATGNDDYKGAEIRVRKLTEDEFAWG